LESDIQEFERISREKRDIKLNLLESRARQALKITDLVEKLNAYNKICPLDGIEHSLDSCTDENAENSRKHRDFIRSTIRFEPYSGCFTCGLP
jgi:hypothetical protein